jgi:hypothetical protein
MHISCKDPKKRKSAHKDLIYQGQFRILNDEHYPSILGLNCNLYPVYTRYFFFTQNRIHHYLPLSHLLQEEKAYSKEHSKYITFLLDHR